MPSYANKQVINSHMPWLKYFIIVTLKSDIQYDVKIAVLVIQNCLGKGLGLEWILSRFAILYWDSVIMSWYSAMLSLDYAILSKDDMILSKGSAILSRESAMLSRDSAILSRDKTGSAFLSQDSAILSWDYATLSWDLRQEDSGILNMSRRKLHLLDDLKGTVSQDNLYSIFPSITSFLSY